MRFVHSRMARCAWPKTACACNSPVAAGQLGQLFAREVVEIIVAEASALARPEKALSIREKVQVVADVHPILVRLGENRAARTAPNINNQEIQAILRAIEALNR